MINFLIFIGKYFVLCLYEAIHLLGLPGLQRGTVIFLLFICYVRKLVLGNCQKYPKISSGRWVEGGGANNQRWNHYHILMPFDFLPRPFPVRNGRGQHAVIRLRDLGMMVNGPIRAKYVN